MPDTWVTQSQLDQFNKLRAEILSKQVKARNDNVIEKETKHPEPDDSDELEYVARGDRLRGHDMDSLDFCHHCLQLKQTQIHVRCRFSSLKHGAPNPVSMHVNGLKVYNASMH
jgi:hypothetical protein